MNGRWRFRLLYLFIAVLLIKAVFFALDSRPAYYLGDSASYLATATVMWIPLDRSFLYGFFVRIIALHSHSLELLVVVQVLLSAITAWLLSFALIQVFRVRFSVAAILGLLCSVEPLALLMERYVMTETCANLLFVMHFVLLLAYLKQGRLWMLLVAQSLGVLLIGVRISFLPEVLVNSVLAPLLSPGAVSWWQSVRHRRNTVSGWRKIATAVVLSVLVTQLLLTGYRHLYGHLAHREPALLYEAGAFLVSDFAPLIEPKDVPIANKRAAVFRPPLLDMQDLDLRPAQHFKSDGIWAHIQRAFPTPRQANDVAVATARNALFRSPLRAAGLAVDTFAEFFSIPSLQRRLLEDEGQHRTFDADTMGLLRTEYGVANPVAYEMSLTKGWHFVAWPWYWLVLCMLSIAPLLPFLCEQQVRLLMAFCAVTAWIFLEGVILTVDRPAPRFLISDAWLVLLMAGALIDRIARRPATSADQSI